MEARDIQCRTFVKSVDALPTVEDLTKALDPQLMGQAYREAGLDSMADNVASIRRATLANQNYEELPRSDYELYVAYLSGLTELKNCFPPDDVAQILIPAQKAKVFDKIIVLTHPTSGESLCLGQVTVKDTTRHFKLGHWGPHLTTIGELRKMQRRQWVKNLSQTIQQLIQRRPQLNFDWLPYEFGRFLYFGIVTVLAAAIPWIILLFFNWFVFAGILICMMTLCGYYVATQTDYADAERYVVGWLIALNAVAAIVVGGIEYNSWYTTDRTEEVLVCNATFGYSGWEISTSAGDRRLEAGFYNGTYYSSGSGTAASPLIGNWVRITEHGYSNGARTGPYITRAQTLRPGTCGQ